MSDEAKPGVLFFVYASDALRLMAQAGMSDADIAHALCSIRAGAIYEERDRVSLLMGRNPPVPGIRSQIMEAEMLSRYGETISEARALGSRL